jgi:AcrR family transcriptional regulator
MAEKGTRQRRHARTRQAILDAAQEIIAERGAEGLSMREIANRIEYSPSGLYEYFSSKDKIIDALCQDGFERLNTQINFRATSDDPAQRLIESGLAYLEFAFSHPEQYLLMFTMSGFNASLEELGLNSAYSSLKRIIQSGIDTHTFRTRASYGLEEMAYQAWTQLHGIVMLRLTLFKHQTADFDAFNRRIVEETIQNMLTS